MIFSTLSEEDVKNITTIMDDEKIHYIVGKDSSMLEQNENSINNPAGHYRAPNFSTNMLAIEIDDREFHKLSDKGLERLLAFGFTHQIPSDADFNSPPAQNKIPTVFKLTNIFIYAFIGGMLLICVFSMFKYLIE